MSHWAELDENNIVVRVLVGDNDDPKGDEGYSWLLENLGGTWKKTSYNGTIHKNFAGVGYYFDEDLDAFIPPKPFESWSLDQEKAIWVSPIPYPQDIQEGEFYIWNEENSEWVLAETTE